MRTNMNQNVEIETDAEDGITEAIAAELIEDVREDGDDGEVVSTYDGIALVDGLSLVALVGLALTTTSGIAVVASFLYRVFHTGVTISCKGGTIRIRKNNELPRGSVLIVHADGTAELREGLSQSTLAGLVRGLLQKPDSTESSHTERDT
jgi:hypothetical protein